METNTLVETTNGSIKILRFNKPRRKNALGRDVYVKLTNILNDAAVDDNISMIVLRGTGDFYSSGNDMVEEPVLTEKFLNILDELIIAFIKFPKIIVSIVNGPAVGIAVTSLAFCDFVFAEENAYFYAPFTKLGVVPEACSTYLFPLLIGQRKAMEMLLLNKRMSAQEALTCGLVNIVCKSEELEKRAWEQIEAISSLPLNSVLKTKKLFRNANIPKLLEVNKMEMDELRTFCVDHKSKL